MAKPVRKTRLLRSLTRAAKAQQSMLTTLLDVYTPAPSKPARKAVPRKPAARSSVARPGLAPATGRWLAGRFALAATSMQYWLYLPEHERPSDGWPLVVMLHGCHQSATQFAQGTRMNHLAEAKGFAVLYPQQSVTAQAQRCWRWYDRATQEGRAETDALASLIGSVCELHPIDQRRIYACGLSAGAGMAAILALNHPERIAAVALHSGPVFGAGHSPIGALHVMRHGAAAHADAIRSVLRGRPAASLPPMPALLIQGEDDQVVDAVNQRQLARQWLQLNGLPAGPATRVALRPAGRGGSRNAHEIHDYVVGRKVVLRVVRIAGLGHAWSGGDPAHAFNAKAGPDASRMVLEFFGRHRR
jgi:poly(hydroxyalkanoate) depolymerase family esterase